MIYLLTPARREIPLEQDRSRAELSFSPLHAGRYLNFAREIPGLFFSHPCTQGDTTGAGTIVSLLYLLTPARREIPHNDFDNLLSFILHSMNSTP